MIKLTSRFGSAPCYIDPTAVVAVLNWKSGSTTIVLNAGSSVNIYVEETVDEVMRLLADWETALLEERNL